MIEFRQFKHVVALDKYRSYRLAADSVFITQPALSLSIKSAEETLGQKLFTKIDGKIVPTAFGELVVEKGIEILQELENLKREIDHVAGVEAGYIRICMSPFIHFSIAEKLTKKFFLEYPSIKLDLISGTWETRLDMLKSKNVDISVDIFVADPEKKIFRESEIEIVEVPCPELVYFVRKGHPLSELPSVTYQEIIKYSWGGEGGSPYYQLWLLEATGLDKMKINPKGLRKFYSQDYYALLSAVLNSDIISAGSSSFFRPYEKSNKIHILDVNWKINHPNPVASLMFLKNRPKSQLIEIASGIIQVLLKEEADKH